MCTSKLLKTKLKCDYSYVIHSSSEFGEIIEMYVIKIFIL